MNLGKPSPKNGHKNEIHIDLYHKWEKVNKEDNDFHRHYFANRSLSHKMLINLIAHRPAKNLIFYR